MSAPVDWTNIRLSISISRGAGRHTHEVEIDPRGSPSTESLRNRLIACAEQAARVACSMVLAEPPGAQEIAETPDNFPGPTATRFRVPPDGNVERIYPDTPADGRIEQPTQRHIPDEAWTNRTVWHDYLNEEEDFTSSPTVTILNHSDLEAIQEWAALESAPNTLVTVPPGLMDQIDEIRGRTGMTNEQMINLVRPDLPEYHCQFTTYTGATRDPSPHPSLLLV